MPNIEIIKVGELKSYVEQENFKELEILPISSQRAISQFSNPRASQNDPALLIAKHNDEIIGYFGLLPDTIDDAKVFWNTCWWSHPEKGKMISMHLFYKALEIIGHQMILTDLTPHTKKLIEATNRFHFEAEIEGKRGFLRFYLSELLPTRKPVFRYFQPLLLIADNVMNLFLSMKLNLIKRSITKELTKFEAVSNIDDETNNFIKNHQDKELTKRQKPELNWILKYPWVLQKDKDKFNEKHRYYFSSYDKSFEYQCFNLYNKQDKLSAFLMFKNRNGHWALPYVYFEEGFERFVIEFIIFQLLNQKAKSFVCFNPFIRKALFDSVSPFYLIKPMTNYFAYSKKLIPDIKKLNLQDGDGDVVFT